MMTNTINQDTAKHSTQFMNVEKQQQIHLLNQILLFLALIAFFLSHFNMAFESNFKVLFDTSSYLETIEGILALLAIYMINRLGYYRLAVWILMLMIGSIISIHVWQSSPPHLELSHYIILLMLAKPLLNKAELLITTLLILICLALASLTIETISIYTAWNIASFVIVLYFLLHIISNYRNSLEHDRRTIIQSSEIRLRMLLDQVPALVWVADNNLNLQSLNGNQDKLLSDFPDYLADIYQKQIPKLNENYIFDHLWNDRHYQNTLQPQLGMAGDTIGYLGITLDITQSKLNRIKEMEIAKKQERHEAAITFLQNASHDFRTPLSVLSMKAYLLEICSEADRPRHIASLQSAIGHLNKMLDDMFYVVKLDTYLPNIQVILINTFLKDITDRYNNKNQEYERQFETNINCSDSCTTIGDLSYLDRAISNVLDNAFQYSSQNDVIEFDARTINERILITITNHNSTISEEHLPHIFDYFFRGEDHRSIDNNNIGLGLTITKKILDLFDGTIHVENKDERHARVIITLPNQITSTLKINEMPHDFM